MKPNVILITIDSLRADHMSCYGYERITTPNIDEFVEQASIYENVFGNGPNTPNSFPAIMCSRYIFETDKYRLPKHWDTIASILKMENYNTIGFNSGNPWLSKYLGYGKGFDEYFEYMELHNRSLNMKTDIKLVKLLHNIFIENFVKSKKELDEKFSSDIIKFIPNLSNPFFLWLHFMDVHYAYNPQKKFCVFGNIDRISNFSVYYLNYLVKMNKKCNKNQFQKIIDLYDSAVYQTDSKIGKIIKLLKKKNSFKDSMIILTSDHGEGFKEHGTFGHQTAPYNELLKVPLIIKYPNQKESIKVKNDVSLINILATIANEVGIKNYGFQRGKCFPKNYNSENEIIFSEGYAVDKMDPITSVQSKKPIISTVKKEGWKLIFNHPNNHYQLYNISSDPKEKSNLIGKNKDILLQLAPLLNKHNTQIKKIKNLKKKIRDKFQPNLKNTLPS